MYTKIGVRNMRYKCYELIIMKKKIEMISNLWSFVMEAIKNVF